MLSSFSKGKWFLLVVLSLIWGSSFILIKKGLVGLTAIQVGSIRIIFTSLFLFSFGLKSIKGLQRKEWLYLGLSGVVGTLVPSFMFAFAETQIDSAVASILNSLTPLNTLVLGSLFFQFPWRKNQILGILIGFFGTLLLVFAGAQLHPSQNYWYALLVVIATIGYALNVNIIKRHLYNLRPMAIAVGNFIVILPFAILFLLFSGLTPESLTKTNVIESIGYIVILAFFGTALAKVLYNRLILQSNPVFASSVTYTIPITALFWGIVDGEALGLHQLTGTALILVGVYLVNRN